MEKSRAENEELEHTGTVIVVHPDWSTTSQLNQGMELLKTRVYNIDFKTLDEWDNSDSDNNDYGASSVALIESMEVLADSIFSFIAARNDLFPEIRNQLKWKTNDLILREGNGTMSGVRIQLTIVFTGERICPPTY